MLTARGVVQLDAARPQELEFPAQPRLVQRPVGFECVAEAYRATRRGVSRLIQSPRWRSDFASKRQHEWTRGRAPKPLTLPHAAFGGIPTRGEGKLS